MLNIYNKNKMLNIFIKLIIILLIKIMIININ